MPRREVMYEHLFGAHERRTLTLLKACRDAQRSAAKLRAFLETASKEDLDDLAARIRNADQR